MNHWNPLEKPLRSWTPRAPSPSLKARLFEQPSAGQTAAAKPVAREKRASLPRCFNPDAWHWLAPAMAVFVLGMFVFGHHPGALQTFHSEPSPNLLATAALTQPDFATYYASVRHSDNNALRSTFEWTNASRSLTSAPSMGQTNSIMP